MTAIRAAWPAAGGVLARAVYYWIVNLLPAWNADLSWDVRLLLVVVAIIDPLVWFAYFSYAALGRSSRLPAGVAVALGLMQLAFAGHRQYRTFSVLSLDTIAFVVGGVLPVVCWSLVLLAQIRGVRLPRVSLLFLLSFGMFQIALYTYSTGNNIDAIREFGKLEPFRLIVTPAIWMFYWITQTLYVRELQPFKADNA